MHHGDHRSLLPFLESHLITMLIGCRPELLFKGLLFLMQSSVCPIYLLFLCLTGTFKKMLFILKVGS